MKDFLSRIGIFLFLIGIGLVLLFIASDASAAITGKRADYSLLCGSVLLFTLSYLFRRKGPPPQAAERFRSIRKIKERREAAKKEKARAQQGKK
jgi:hypothetical protein